MEEHAATAGTDPALVRTRADFAAGLSTIRKRSGLSYSGITAESKRLCAEDAKNSYGRRYAAVELPKSTVGDLLSGATLPSPKVLVTLLRVCRVSPYDIPRWLAARQALEGLGGTSVTSSRHTSTPRRIADRSAPHGDDEQQVNRHAIAGESTTLHEPLPPRLSPEQPGGGLPGEVTYFTGRDGPMAQLRGQVAEQTPQGTVVTIYAIDGMAGVGKTAFARHASHELVERYPDGAIWVDLYGHTPGIEPREPANALEQMLLQLGVPPEVIKADLIQRQEQWRHHLRERRMLIVLDDARTSDQVLPLLPEAPGCLVLITSRRKLTGVIDAYPLFLDVLGWDEAEQLFIKLVGEQRCRDHDAVRQILAACGRLPLAIRLIAGRLRHHGGELLADVATDLADQAAALDALVAEHLSVRAAFGWSYRLLNDEQRRSFRLLGWHPGPEITPVVIAAVAAVSAAQGKQLLHELADHNMLDLRSVAGVPGGPRYRMHDLVRLYAQERADAEEPQAEQAAAVDRLACSYMAITREADRLLRPDVAGDPVKSTGRRTILTFADASQARSWLTAERHNLLGCVRAVSPTTDVADLSTVLAVHFRDFGFWSDVLYLYDRALIVYRQLGHRRGEIDALWGLGEIQRLIGECDKAREYHNQALILARQRGYQRAEIDALRGLGEVEWLVGEHSRARDYYTQALALARQLGDRRAEAEALQGLGQVQRLVGEYGQAREYHIQALALARQRGDRRAEADVLWGLGRVERYVGEYDQAREYHTQALTLARQLGYRRAEAEALRGLGQVERFAGECNQARAYYTQALTLSRQLGYQRVEGDALWGLGDVEWLVGEYHQAREYHTQALALARQLGYWRAELDVLQGLGQVERFVGEYGEARGYYTQALTLSRQLGYQRVEEVDVLRELGRIERFVGEYGQAREYHTQALALAQNLGFQLGAVLVLRELGQVERFIGEYGPAREYHNQALTLARRLGYRRGEVLVLRALGQVERVVGEYGLAREYHNQALTLTQQVGDWRGQVDALRELGEVERFVGEYGPAREYHTRALALARQLGDRRREVLVLQGLGEVERVVGEYGPAREYHNQALTLARQLGYRRAELEVLRGMGQMERLVGEYRQARLYHTQALTLARQLGDRSGEAEALWALGHVASDTEERSEACELWQKAVEIYEEVGVPFAKTVRAAMCRLSC